MKYEPRKLELDFTPPFQYTSIELTYPNIPTITIGYLRDGDRFGTEGEEQLTIWYQDGTKWTINKSWFE